MLGATLGVVVGLFLGGPVGLLVGRMAEFAVAIGLGASFVVSVVQA